MFSAHQHAQPTIPTTMKNPIHVGIVCLDRIKWPWPEMRGGRIALDSLRGLNRVLRGYSGSGREYSTGLFSMAMAESMRSDSGDSGAGILAVTALFMGFGCWEKGETSEGEGTSSKPLSWCVGRGGGLLWSDALAGALRNPTNDLLLPCRCMLGAHCFRESECLLWEVLAAHSSKRASCSCPGRDRCLSSALKRKHAGQFCRAASLRPFRQPRCHSRFRFPLLCVSVLHFGPHMVGRRRPRTFPA